jgi:FkbM family methyltransferase
MPVHCEYTWREASAAIASHYVRDPNLLALQIGANDGVLVDPIENMVAMGMRAHMVEPHPSYFADLENLHADHPWVTMSRVAIGSEADPAKPLYYLADTDGLTNVAKGVASFNIAHVAEFAQHEHIDDFERRLASVDVPVITYPELLDRLPNKEKPAILVVDVEGMDAEIVDAGLGVSPRPRVIMFEHQHLSNEVHHRYMGKLAALGYHLMTSKDETLAMVKPKGGYSDIRTREKLKATDQAQPVEAPCCLCQREIILN